MRPEEIQRHVAKRPFEPFRVSLSDGSSIVVEHPELILVTRTSVTIAVRPRPGALPVINVFVDPIHVTRVDPVNGSGGRQGRRRKR